MKKFIYIQQIGKNSKNIGVCYKIQDTLLCKTTKISTANFTKSIKKILKKGLKKEIRGDIIK